MQTLDQRVVAIEQATNSLSAATINAIGSLIKTVSQLESVDRKALWDDLEALKEVQVQNGNQGSYLQIISLFQSSIS